MPFMTRFFSFLGFKPTKKIKYEEEYTMYESVFMDYMFSLIADKSLIAAQQELYEKAKKLDVEKRNYNFFSLYLQLEEFIVSHHTPVLVKNFTREELRKTIAHKFEIDKLDPKLGVLFFTNHRQIIQLCNVVSDFFFQPVCGDFGTNTVIKLVKKITPGTILENIPFDGYYFNFPPDIAVVPQEKLFSTFHTINTALYENIRFLFGQQKAEEIKDTVHHFVEEKYSTIPHLVALMRQVLPP